MSTRQAATEQKLRDNLRRCRERVSEAARRCSRSPEAVSILLATKTQAAAKLNIALQEGFRLFGENRLQDAQSKIENVGGTHLPAPIWHFIGRLQSNKIKSVLRFCSMVHSLDRAELALALNRVVAAMPAQSGGEQRTVDVLVQVNTSNEASKGGVLVHDIARLIDDIQPLPHIRLRGLMTLAALSDSETQVRSEFALLRRLAARSRTQLDDGNAFDTLSMGMSNDFELAVAEGSTMVRIGSAAFGARGQE